MARKLLVDIAVALGVTSALVTTALTVRREFFTPTASAQSPRQASVPVPVPNWQKYVASGRIVGPRDAPLQLVEFADFQCPACRDLHLMLTRLEKEFPNAFAVSYHYVPLAYHRRAYDAARAAECAAHQNRFEAMHDLLFANFASLDTITFVRVAEHAGIPDINAFLTCSSDTARVSRIDHDQSLALDTLKIVGTPTMLVNGMMYAFAPPIKELTNMIREAAARQKTRKAARF